MANIKISQLTQAADVTDQTFFEVQQAALSKKASGEQIKDYVLTYIPQSDLDETNPDSLSFVKNKIKNELDARVVPTASDDETQGFSRTSLWFYNHHSTADIYMCVVSDEAAAVWVRIG